MGSALLSSIDRWVDPVLLLLVVLVVARVAVARLAGGGVLSDREICAAMRRGDVVIQPFRPESLGGNSYDVTLGNVLRVHATTDVARVVEAYCEDEHPYQVPPVSPELMRHAEVMSSRDGFCGLDMSREPEVIDVVIPPDGIVLLPGILYLASTVEYTETLRHVPYLDGRSSVGRLGIGIHATAGRGDVGFRGHWTMEIWVVQPVRVFAGVRIGQLTYHTVSGAVERNYQSKPGATYSDSIDYPLPRPSGMWKSLRGPVP